MDVLKQKATIKMNKDIIITTFTLSQYEGLVGEISYSETDNHLSLAFKIDGRHTVGPNAMDLTRDDAIEFANALSQSTLYCRRK